MNKNLIIAYICCIMICGCKENRSFESVETESFEKIIAQDNVQLVDVRTAEEYLDGYIPGAINMDVKSVDFDSLITTLDKKNPVAIYCRSGRRSKHAAQRMSEIGLQVIELDGGILSWQGTIENQE